ncbi:MAG: arginine repressor [Lachnospiraceae bacterium]|nr:arginine repressor [Lachnospiraceae bacterium]
MKSKRQRKILEIITNNSIETQEELAQALIREGYNVTQATVSRDIREMELSKVSVNGRQKYAVSVNGSISANNKYVRVLNDGVISVETAGNLLVIKTVPGMAMAVAAAIDALEIKEIVGCIAGDDTIMCAIKNADDTETVKEVLESQLDR